MHARCFVEACCLILFRREYGIQAIQELVSSAGPGGAHEHTMFMVFGDHGQTMTGDHGGGAPEEVDSALFALHMGAYHQIRSNCASSPLATAQCCVHITTVIQLWWLRAAPITSCQWVLCITLLCHIGPFDHTNV